MVLATPSALSLLPRRDLEGLLDRHAGGDWGDVCRSDAMANDDYALGHGGRLLSAYETPAGRYGSSPRPTAPRPRASCPRSINALLGLRRRGPRPQDRQVEDRGAHVRAVRSLLGSDEGCAVDRPRPRHGPRRLPGVVRVVLLGGAGRRHPRRQAGRPVRHLPRVQKASSSLAHRCGERHIREGRQMYPNTGGKTITTIAAHTA